MVNSDSRCISLHGMGGIGKTSLAYAIGRWLHERNRYRDGVWFISLRDTKSVSELIAKITQELELSSFALKKELRNSRSFLILDDLDELLKNEPEELIEQLNTLIEQCGYLGLLLTSRTSLAGDLVDCNQQEVFSMGKEETKKIFKRYAPPQAKWGKEDLREDFERLVTFLDGYPLPIRLAGSYMKENQCTLKMLCEDLDIEPLEVLGSYSPQQKKERSLRVTLERSFKGLSVQAKDIFPLLAFFPSGLSRDLAMGIWGRSGNQVLMELLKFSMAEKLLTATDWRINLPEPARTYAETKLQEARGIDYYAPHVLEFYYEDFREKIIKYFVDGNSKLGQELLLQESSNLVLFLEWGYENEISELKICNSARITALLSHHWRWIEPNQDPLIRLNQALTTAQRNQDKEAENKVNQAIAILQKQGEFKTVQSLGEENNDDLQYFEFNVIKVNEKGEEIQRERKQAQYYREDLGNDVFLDLVAIPEGTFMMGSPEGERNKNEKPQHQVTVQPFFMGRYPITQAQWKAVAQLPQVGRELPLEPSGFKGDKLPVQQLSWYDAVEFCARLTRETGKIYRLPSEAEWEYACRAGTKTPFHFGETISTDLANYHGTEYRRKTTEVDYFDCANEFGLSDMHGNVWEWCADPWHDNYNNAPDDGTVWDEKNNDRIYQNYLENIDTLLSFERRNYVVLRGGSWLDNPYYCRSSYRFNLNARGNIIGNNGFRVVCELGTTL